jgi:tetratricopeptide (TPR) repeat protein
MTNPPLDCGIQFSKRHKQFYRELYVDRSTHPITRSQTSNTDAVGDVEQHEDDEVQKYDSSRSWDILYSTVVILKEAGNAALQKSLNCLAARYYDKAILYCALAYMEFPVGNTDFLLDHQLALSENSGCECRWTALLKTFIQIRLNMSLCYLKNGVDDTKAAIFQAKMALRELKPFVAKKGCVMTGKKLDRCRLEEPDTTYTEAKALQSKAYFRLGSAQFLLSEFDDAIESFEESIKSSSESSPEKKPDASVLRKLQEAKLANKRHCNSERKKFKFAFAPKEKELADQCEEASTSR